MRVEIFQGGICVVVPTSFFPGWGKVCGGRHDHGRSYLVFLVHRASPGHSLGLVQPEHLGSPALESREMKAARPDLVSPSLNFFFFLSSFFVDISLLLKERMRNYTLILMYI